MSTEKTAKDLIKKIKATKNAEELQKIQIENDGRKTVRKAYEAKMLEFAKASKEKKSEKASESDKKASAKNSDAENKPLNAKETAKLIKSTKSKEELDKLNLAGDERKTVQDALNAQLKSFEKDEVEEEKKNKTEEKKSQAAPVKPSEQDERERVFRSKIPFGCRATNIIKFAEDFFAKNLVSAERINRSFDVRIKIDNPEHEFDVRGV